MFALFGEVQYLHGLSFTVIITASLILSLLVRKQAFCLKSKVIDPTSAFGNSENDKENCISESDVLLLLIQTGVPRFKT